MKTCYRCALVKPLGAFNADRATKDGLNIICRECRRVAMAAWREANREQCREYQRAYTARHPERVKAAKLAYFEANKEKALAAARRWQAENPHLRNAATARRYVRKKHATPSWACPYIIEWYYFDARWMTEQTGVAHQVDHVIPLRHPRVCGLHVETNLQVIPAVDNIKKNNKYDFA